MILYQIWTSERLRPQLGLLKTKTWTDNKIKRPTLRIFKKESTSELPSTSGTGHSRANATPKLWQEPNPPPKAV
jgi:hypothetical protein